MTALPVLDDSNGFWADNTVQREARTGICIQESLQLQNSTACTALPESNSSEIISASIRSRSGHSHASRLRGENLAGSYSNRCACRTCFFPGYLAVYATGRGLFQTWECVRFWTRIDLSFTAPA